MNHVMIDGFVSSLSSAGNVGILVFLVILVCSSCYDESIAVSAAKLGSSEDKNSPWRTVLDRHLGILIFVDDYFNCSTVGSVMKPPIDKYNISRAKLAYLIDATAAPIAV